MEMISVIVPVYNVETYLSRCINSILNQTYRNLEIILINDGSTDNSDKICDDFDKRDERIIVIHKKNGGQSSARNEGLKVASGEYIGFVDSDDWIHQDMYQHLYDILKETNSDISDISGVLTKSQMTVNQPDKVIKVHEGKEILRDYLYTGLSNSVGQFAVWRKLYKKDLFNGIKFLEGKINEDILINYELLSKAQKLVRSNRILYFYFQDDKSTTRNGLKKKDSDLLDICERIVELAENESYKDIRYLADVKLARSYFSLLAKIAFYGIDDNQLDSTEIVNYLTKKLRENYFLLIRSPMPFNRKLMVTGLCINFHVLSIPLSIYKKVKRL